MYSEPSIQRVHSSMIKYIHGRCKDLLISFISSQIHSVKMFNAWCSIHRPYILIRVHRVQSILYSYKKTPISTKYLWSLPKQKPRKDMMLYIVFYYIRCGLDYFFHSSGHILGKALLQTSHNITQC